MGYAEDVGTSGMEQQVPVQRAVGQGWKSGSPPHNRCFPPWAVLLAGSAVATAGTQIQFVGDLGRNGRMWPVLEALFYRRTQNPRVFPQRVTCPEALQSDPLRPIRLPDRARNDQQMQSREVCCLWPCFVDPAASPLTCTLPLTRPAGTTPPGQRICLPGRSQLSAVESLSLIGRSFCRAANGSVLRMQMGNQAGSILMKSDGAQGAINWISLAWLDALQGISSQSACPGLELVPCCVLLCQLACVCVHGTGCRSAGRIFIACWLTRTPLLGQALLVSHLQRGRARARRRPDGGLCLTGQAGCFSLRTGDLCDDGRREWNWRG